MSAIVAFVLNDARHDSRVQREAATLAASGHLVTIVARTVDPYASGPEFTSLAGVPVIRVPVASGLLRWALLTRRPARLAAAAVELGRRNPLGLVGGVAVGLLAAVPAAIAAVPLLLGAVLVRVFPPAGAVWRGVSWRLSWWFAVLPWARAAAGTASAEAPGAVIFWAHDLRALPAAIAARQAAGGGAVVYDAHEVFPEAGAHARRPAWARRHMAALERTLASEAQALVTVNDALAERLGPALGFSRVVIAHNCPPRWTPSSDAAAASPLRAAAGVPVDAPLLLYHGGLAPGRGIESLLAAMAEPGLESAHLVFMGSGPSRAAVAAVADAPGSRVHLLDPVTPDQLLDWVAGADVVVAPIQPTTLNHRLSSPNKVFEGLAAGVPVVGSDLPGIRSVLLADPDLPLGALVDPDDPSALARGIRSILELPTALAGELRARCLAAAHDRWNWETESAGLIALVEELGAPVTSVVEGEGPDPASRPEPQRICFILASTGRFDARTQRLAVDLADRGHSVTIIARAGSGPPDQEASHPSIDIIRVDAGGQSQRSGRPRARVLRPLIEVLRILGVIQQARRQTRAVRDLGIHADVVHAMGFLALPSAVDLHRRAGARLVYDARDLYVESNNIARLPRLLRALFAWQEGRWARAADRVLTVNESCAAYLAQRYRVRRPVVVMNGQRTPDLPQSRPDRIRDRLGIPAERRIILYHGGFMPDRGLDQLIKAAEEPGLAGAEVVLMGSGATEPRLREQAAASPAGERIHFLPAVPPEQLLEWVASADVGVMPNQPRTLNERFSTPNKLFECLAAGTPVVSSDFPERRRILMGDPDGPLGRVCDPTSPGAIASAISEVLDLPPDEAAAIRERCRRAARERFGWPTQFARTIAAYGEITGHPW